MERWHKTKKQARSLMVRSCCAAFWGAQRTKGSSCLSRRPLLSTTRCILLLPVIALKLSFSLSLVFFGSDVQPFLFFLVYFCPYFFFVPSEWQNMHFVLARPNNFPKEPKQEEKKQLSKFVFLCNCMQIRRREKRAESSLASQNGKLMRCHIREITSLMT